MKLSVNYTHKHMHLKNYAVAVTAIVKVVIQGEGACLFLLYEL